MDLLQVNHSGVAAAAVISITYDIVYRPQTDVANLTDHGEVNGEVTKGHASRVEGVGGVGEGGEPAIYTGLGEIRDQGTREETRCK